MTAGYLIDDGGLISMGPEGEAAFGYQHFLELLSVFTSPPMLSVRHGRVEVGVVPDETLMIRPPGQGAGGPAVLLLAGRSWAVRHVDWTRRVVDVEPTEAPGIARWQGSGQPLSSAVASAVRQVLVGIDPAGVTIGRRAAERLDALRAERWWVRLGQTTLVRDDKGRLRWWTFGGWRANLWLAEMLRPLRSGVVNVDDLSIAVDSEVTVQQLQDVLRGAREHELRLDDRAVAAAATALKFSECLPEQLAEAVVEARLGDLPGVRRVLAEPVGSAS